MLKTRVITAIVLLAVIVPALFLLPQTGWAVLVAAFIGVGAWEWGGLLRWSASGRRLLGLVVALLCAALAFADPDSIGAAGRVIAAPWALAVYGASAILWVAVMPLWLRHRWALGGGSLGLTVGLLLLVSTWLALVQLRAHGPLVLLGTFAIVWIADIAAYFAGRAFGRHKLAPNISPGKTWEGAAGAVAGVLLYGVWLHAGAGVAPLDLPPWLALMLGLTALSIIGDLFESMLKRQAGIKDSSQVLPGHGGVLDRIDSLTSTLPLVALLWLCFATPGCL